MNKSRFSALLSSALLFVILSLSPAASQSKSDLLKSLNFQHGIISLGDGFASLKLTDKYAYLNSDDSRKFLTQIWGNPPSVAEGALGMLVPMDVSPLTAEGWAVIIRYEASGYVSDDDAENIDYTSLLKDMQEEVRTASVERQKQGYESFELLGWARQPYYDKKEKKLYWAKRVRFGNSSEETLNYEIRILGRRGVLDLNAIADMKDMARIDRSAPDILSMVSFNQGNTYSEFNPSVDKAAAYGIAGLIAGGVLTKVGFFKGLIALILAFKKLVAVGVFVTFAGLWKTVKSKFQKKSPA